jgi:micrococcal nuclease
MKLFSKNIIALFIILVISAFTVTTELVGKVIGITDGDTITILQDNVQYKIRLLDIDAPEKKQAFGQASKQFLSTLIAGKIVHVTYHKYDRNKRVLGTVYCDGKNINELMVQNGMAWHFKKYSSSAIFSNLELKARQQKIGLWQDINPIAPWDFRHHK